MQHETRGTLGGTAMIAGAAMALATMALHPTGHDIARDPARLGALNVAVHSLALAGLPVSFYGGFALTRRLSRDGELAQLALAFYGAALVAAMLAATASGFLAPDLVVRAQAAAGEAQVVSAGLLHYTGAVNQAFAKLLVGASSVAIGLWSAEIVRTRLLRRSSGIVGYVVAAITLAALLSGRLRLDVHGFGAVVLAQTVWLVMVGAELRRAGDSGVPGSGRGSR